MPINTVTGAVISIADTTFCETAEEFEALSWTDIGEVEDIGKHGDKRTIVQFLSVADDRTRKLKGSADAGDFELICGRDDGDAGQIALDAAVDVKLDYAIRIAYANPATFGGTGSIEYFMALVGSREANDGTANNVMRKNYMVAINTKPLLVRPT